MNQKRILVIDDEKPICRFLAEFFSSHQFDVRSENEGRKGLQAVIDYRPHLVVLDLGLPDIDGIKVLTEIRSWSQIPIIILSANSNDVEKVLALDSGADDYLTKPFSNSELLARIRVAFRHADFKDGSAVIKIGYLEVDLTSHSVYVDKERVQLTSIEYDILKVLVKNCGKVVTHKNLLKEVWGPNASEHTQYVRVYVGHIRKKLRIRADLPECIMTEAGIGYRLIEPV